MATRTSRFSVVLANLAPIQGGGIGKTRPAVVISPDDMNHKLDNIIVAPMTSTTSKNWPTRIPLTFDGKQGVIALDQIRTISKGRVIKQLGVIDNQTAQRVCDTLVELFRL